VEIAKAWIFQLAVKKAILYAWFVKKTHGITERLGDGAASLFGFGAGILCLLVIPDSVIARIGDKISGLHLASAGMIATIFTLVLTLSVIPAQRAAEAFSPAVLGLYRDDWTIRSVLWYLAATAMFSAFLGLDWTFGLSSRFTLALQFLILGTSLDSIRLLYWRVLNLFDGRIAAELLQGRAEQHIKKYDWHVKRVANLFRIPHHGPLSAADISGIQAILYKNSERARAYVLSFADHLLELGIRAIRRQDSYGARAALNALGGVAITYMDIRRSSLVMMPDMDYPLLLQGRSDMQGVLVPIYEAVKSVNDEATRQGDQRIVQGAIMALGSASRHAMTVVIQGNQGVNSAPLVYFSVDTLERCIESACRTGMVEAARDAVGQLGELLKVRQAKVDTWEADCKAVEILRSGTIYLGRRQLWESVL
jgi:hypothetical protein